MEITQELVSQCNSFAELSRCLGRTPHNRLTHQLRDKLTSLNISFSHFTRNGIVAMIPIKKLCPICKEEFEIGSGHDDKQITCSYTCANTYFARKRNKNPKRYTTICWYNHEKKCVVCGEDKIVAVHHMDENNKNNDPKNLVPLCPTHHQYWHSRYRELIRSQVEKFLRKIV